MSAVLLLVLAVGVASQEPPSRLTEEQAREDLALLREELEQRSSYVHSSGLSVDEIVGPLEQRVAGGVERRVFGIGVARAIAKIQDSHARVRGLGEERGFLPFLMQGIGEGYVAYLPDRTRLLDPQRPWIVAIDGRPIEEWVALLDEYVTRGTRAHRVFQAMRRLRAIQHVRRLVGDEPRATLTVTLRSDAGDRESREMAISDQFPSFGEWPRGRSRRMGDLGYLRLEEMDRGAVRAVRRWMPRFQDTRGLIVDVRGNRGGDRDALRELAPWFLGPEEPPRVANVAHYRRTFEKDYLEQRYLFRIGSSRWSAAQRQAILEFAKAFEPEFAAPRGLFSARHYFVLSRESDDERPFYSKPVVVLLDDLCNSATDIFLGAFKGWPRITLVGQGSAGGSARSRQFQLPHSGLKIRMATMLSYQPDGLFYDGHGITPDVVVERRPTDLISGGTDTTLEQALEILDRGR